MKTGRQENVTTGRSGEVYANDANLHEVKAEDVSKAESRNGERKKTWWMKTKKAVRSSDGLVVATGWKLSKPEPCC